MKKETMSDYVRLKTSEKLARVYELMMKSVFRHIYPTEKVQIAHEHALRLLTFLDRNTQAQVLLGVMSTLLDQLKIPFEQEVGGVQLSSSMILAAGLVKVGRELPFTTDDSNKEAEQKSLASAERGMNMLPGLVFLGKYLNIPIEIGSVSRWPRLGNEVPVLGRFEENELGWNRVGLRNPGVKAVARYLETLKLKDKLPQTFGINITITPGVSDINHQTEEVVFCIQECLEHGVSPSWFTLNVSCPTVTTNSARYQETKRVAQLCESLQQVLRDYGAATESPVPLWVKVGPELQEEQYSELLNVFNQTGVRAVVATNTLPRTRVEGDKELNVGFSGQKLFPYSLPVAHKLAQEIRERAYPIDVVGCGGINSVETMSEYIDAGVVGLEAFSAMVTGGPLRFLANHNSLAMTKRSETV